MRALSIRQPHAEAILRGVKRIEYRSRSTRVRGRIYIYAGLGRYPSEDEARMMEEYGITDIGPDTLRRGALIGTVDLYKCTGERGAYEWHVRGPRRLQRPRKPVNHPQPSWLYPF